MSKDKKLLMTAGISGFVAGLLGAGLGLYFCCCPNVNNKAPVSDLRPSIEMVQHHMKHHGKHEMMGKKHRHFDHRFDERRHHEPSAEMKARFAEKLGLSEEQKIKLDEMRKEDMEKMEPVMKQIESLRAEMKQMRSDARKRFESVLTDEQKQILDEMKKEHFHKK